MEIDKDVPIQPEIEIDGMYAYCPICEYFDLHPTDVITTCPSCNQLIDWSWMRKFKEQV